MSGFCKKEMVEFLRIRLSLPRCDPGYILERTGRIQGEVAMPHEQCLMESRERLNCQEAGPETRPGDRPPQQSCQPWELL